jgi:uncharacterized protein YecT (DUF1311 family)
MTVHRGCQRHLVLSPGTIAGVTVLLLLAMGLPAADAAASSTPVLPRPTYNSKCETTAVSQIAMDRCVAKEVAQLNSELKLALEDGADHFGVATVEKVQRAWVDYEKMECGLEESPYKGGTIQPHVYGACEVELLVQRINVIDAGIRATPK